jgi:hypothetical protein
MSKEVKNEVSQREYAKLLGVSPKAVRNAIKAGKIVDGWNEGTQKINVRKANSEWVPVKAIRSAGANIAPNSPQPAVIPGAVEWDEDDKEDSPIVYALACELGVDKLTPEQEGFVGAMWEEYDESARLLADALSAAGGNRAEIIACVTAYTQKILINVYNKQHGAK